MHNVSWNIESKFISLKSSKFIYILNPMKKQCFPKMQDTAGEAGTSS